MKNAARRHYEKEEYVLNAESYAKEVKAKREETVNKYVSTETISLLELGCGSGILKSLRSNWVGLDISSSALKRARPSSVITCDIQNMPIRDRAVGAIASFNTLEHIQNPEETLEECCRVLLPGGVLVFQESWFCEVLRLHSVGLARKIAIGVRRLARELILSLGVKNLKLRFRKISPNYGIIGEDWDAVSSIDPHDMLCWFKSREYIPLNEADKLLLRCLSREPFKNEDRALAVRKPSASPS